MPENRTAIPKLYTSLKEKLENDGCGGYKKVNINPNKKSERHCPIKSFFVDLLNILYNLSTFHDNFKLRGCQIPEYFAFSKDADNWRQKNKKVK